MTRWPSVAIKRVARLGSGHTPSRQHPEYWENCTIPWLTLADVWQLRDGTRSVIDETAETISEIGVRNSSAVVHPAGSVALSRTASVGFSCLLGRSMATSQDFAVWTCGPRLSPRFLLWVLRGSDDALRERMTGSTHKTVYMPDIETLRTPLPPMRQQEEIADFLDRETARIDALIAAKARVADRLEERWQSVMAAAVSGEFMRCDRNRSPLPWMLTMPSHWPVAKLTLIARLGSGHTPSRSRAEWWTDATIPWITTGEVAQMRSDRIEYVTATREHISELGLANSSATVHPAGTVVLCRTASAGYSAIMGLDMATSQDFATWTCGPTLRPRFLLLCLRAMRPDLLGRLAMGSTHKTIYMPDIESIRVPLPSLEEQDACVEAAYLRLGSIESVSERINKQIALLREHRRALISAAVMGDLEVAGVAA